MSLLFADGFEFANAGDNETWNNVGSAWQWEATPYNKNTVDNHVYRNAVNANDNNLYHYMLYDTQNTGLDYKNTLTMGAAFGCDSDTTLSAGEQNVGLFRFDGPVLPHVYVAYKAGFNGRYDLEVRRWVNYDVEGVLLARTYNKPIRAQGYNYVEAQVFIDPTSGWVKVRVDGDELISETGLQTQELSAGNDPWVSVVRVLADGVNGSEDTRVDNFYVTNTINDDGQNLTGFLGPISIETLRPAGTGSVNDFIGSDGNSVDNHLLVDNVLMAGQDDDYVESSGVGDTELYTMPTLYHDDLNIKAIFINHRCQKLAPFSKTKVATIYKFDNNIYTGYEFLPKNLPSMHWTGVYFNPHTGSGWTTSDINNLEFGTKLLTSD